jgi:SagB-type dehydrogenase family enzyme
MVLLRDDLLVSLRTDVSVSRREESLLLASPTHTLAVDAKPPWRADAVERLRDGCASEHALLDAVAQRVERRAVERLLARMNDRGMLCYRHPELPRTALGVYPYADRFWNAAASRGDAVRLSRFACVRRTGDDLRIEHPLAGAYLLTVAPPLGELLVGMARPVEWQSLEGVAMDVAEILFRTGILVPVEAREDNEAPLASWTFHEMLFHARSRRGTSDQMFALGSRFRENVDPPPALWFPKSLHPPWPLPRPDEATLTRKSRPFLDVLARRRSRREVGPAVITAAELGAVLYLAARVRGEFSLQGRTYTERPYPNGGSLYELEIYLTVRPTPQQEIAPGFYHYDPQAHTLALLAPYEGHAEVLTAEAYRASGEVSEPQILVTISARFDRVMWKYQAFAYSLILKNVGCLLQTLCLVATDLDLAACAIGSGNSRVFAALIGRPLEEESSVGELTLGKPSTTAEPPRRAHSAAREGE